MSENWLMRMLGWGGAPTPAGGEQSRALATDSCDFAADVRDGQILDRYKGFVSRPCLGYPGTVNVMYVCEDGEERCCGQSHNFRGTVEGIIRDPLPTWMTKKAPALSQHHDAELVRRTCAHGVSLSADCDRCIESYGSARIR